VEDCEAALKSGPSSRGGKTIKQKKLTSRKKTAYRGKRLGGSCERRWRERKNSRDGKMRSGVVPKLLPLDNPLGVT